MIATSRTILARVGAVAFVLLTITCVAHAAGSDADDGWRRTKDGWEHISTWNLGSRTLPTRRFVPPSTGSLLAIGSLHPALIATGLLLLSIGSLNLSVATAKPN